MIPVGAIAANLLRANAGPPPLQYYADNGANFPFSGTTYPQGLYVSAVDRTYIIWEGWTGTVRRHFITYYDHAENNFGPVVQVGNRGLTDDAHGVPAIVRDNDGYLHVFGSSHNSNMLYWSSVAPDDITNWNGEFSITGLYTYAHPVNIGGAIYLFMRLDGGGSTLRLILRKTTSVSGGVLTFGSEQSMVNLGTDSRIYATQFHAVGTDIYFVASKSDYLDTTREDVYGYKYDTVTGSISNFEADTTIVAGDLPVDITESNADFKIVDETGDSNIPAFCFDTSGNIHVVWIIDTGATYTVRHKMWNGTVWSSVTDVGEVTYRYDVISVVPLASGAIEVWWPEDDDGDWVRGGNMVRRQRDSGGTWGAEESILDATTFALGQPNMVKDATAVLRVLFCENAQTENDADAGDLKLYAHGDGGFLTRQPVEPTDIKLSTNRISELWPTGQTFAIISAIDNDPNDTFTYSIVSDPDSKFTISGNGLRLSASLDYGTATSHSVTIRATDSYGLTFDKAFTINVLEEDLEPMALIATYTPSAVATLDMTLPTGYAAFRIIGWLKPATDDVGLWLRADSDGGASFDTGASDYDWKVFQDDGSTSARFSDGAENEITILGADTGVGNAGSEKITFDITLFDPADTTVNKSFDWKGSRRNASGTLVHFIGAGTRLSTADVDALRLMFASGNIASGRVSLLGIPN